MDSKQSAASSDPVLEDESESHTRPNVKQMIKSFEDTKQKGQMARSTEDQNKSGNMGRATGDQKQSERVLRSTDDQTNSFIRQPKTEYDPVDDISSELSADEYYNKKEVRIILIGKTGSGKSATANTILGGEKFKSKTSGSSITRKCQRGTTQLDGRIIQLVDTPGLFDTGMSNEMTMKEIVKCISLVTPGPHAIILVVRIGRFTQEEDATVKYLRNRFGENMMKYLIVLFTGKDELDDSFAQLLEEVPENLKNILRDCNNRAIAFNNKFTSNLQRSELLKMIDSMVDYNGKRYYNNEMFREAELAVCKREEEIRLEEKNKFRRNKEELETAFGIFFCKLDNNMKRINVQLNLHLEGATVSGNTMANPDADAHRKQTQDEIRSLQKELESLRKENDSAKQDLERKLNEELKSHKKSNTYEYRRECVRDEVEKEEGGFWNFVGNKLNKGASWIGSWF